MSGRAKLCIIAAMMGVALAWAFPGKPHTPLLDMYVDHQRRKAEADQRRMEAVADAFADRLRRSVR